MKEYKKHPPKPLFADEKQGEIFLSLIKEPTYRKVAKCLFIDGMTNEETAFEIGYCVRQIERIRKSTLQVVLKMLVEIRTPKKPKTKKQNTIQMKFEPSVEVEKNYNQCPLCDEVVTGGKFCDHCGQALDWGNSNENI